MRNWEIISVIWSWKDIWIWIWSRWHAKHRPSYVFCILSMCSHVWRTLPLNGVALSQNILVLFGHTVSGVLTNFCIIAQTKYWTSVAMNYRRKHGLWNYLSVDFSQWTHGTIYQPWEQFLHVNTIRDWSQAFEKIGKTCKLWKQFLPVWIICCYDGQNLNNLVGNSHPNIDSKTGAS